MAKVTKRIALTSIKSKKGIKRKMLPDDTGYYTMIVGALNVFNSRGEFYRLPGGVEQITNGSSIFNRRLKRGAVRSEVDHPEFDPTKMKTVSDYIKRIYKIDKNNVCAHIKEVWLEETDIPSGFPGAGNVVFIKAKIKPSGIKAKGLQDALENEDENVMFSIRSITDVTKINGITVRTIKDIVTFDWVLEPGIEYASSWKELGIESIRDDITEIGLEEIFTEEGTLQACVNCGIESETKDMISSLYNLVSVDNSNDPMDRW
jgi:hypothetical protein